MKFKQKEAFNFKSFTERKRIIEEALDLMSVRTNFTSTDVHFYTMMAFVNAMVEENIIVYCMSEEADLMNKLLNDVEPAFEELISNEDVYNYYHSIVEEIEDYMYREFESNQGLVSLLNKGFEMLGELDYTKVFETIRSLMPTEIQKELPKTNAMAIDESNKIKDLIAKYTNETTNTTTL